MIELQNNGAKIANTEYAQKEFGKDKIAEFLSKKTNQLDQEKYANSFKYPVYAGNEFYKHLEDWGDQKENILKMVGRLGENPNHKSDNDDNPEAWNSDCYSRRINGKDRLIYRVTNGVVQCLFCLFCKRHNTKLERSDKVVINSLVCKYKLVSNNRKPCYVR